MNYVCYIFVYLGEKERNIFRKKKKFYVFFSFLGHKVFAVAPTYVE